MKEIQFNLFKEPNNVDFESLGELIREYPWFSTLHILWLFKIKNERPEDFEKELKAHIIYIRNRKQLYNILYKGQWEVLLDKVEKSGDAPEPGPEDEFEDFEKELLEFSYEEGNEKPPGGMNERSEELEEPAGSEQEESNEHSPHHSEHGQDGFTGWINRYDQGNKNRIELIDRFLEAEPGPIRPDMATSLKGDVSVNSIEENDHFITDTLAKIYIKQGLYSKAIFAYEKLSLKYPEKSAYFAAQIEEIKSLTQNNK